jgi:hypothetical protein
MNDINKIAAAKNSKYEAQKIEMFKAAYFETTMEEVESNNAIELIMAQLIEWERLSKTDAQKQKAKALQGASLKMLAFNISNRAKLSRAIIDMLDERRLNKTLVLENKAERNTIIAQQNEINYHLAEIENLKEKLHEHEKWIKK